MKENMTVKELFKDYNTINQNMSVVYFTSSQIAEDSIKAVGEDRIKKYLFGVK